MDKSSCAVVILFNDDKKPCQERQGFLYRRLKRSLSRSFQIVTAINVSLVLSRSGSLAISTPYLSEELNALARIVGALRRRHWILESSTRICGVFFVADSSIVAFENA